MLSFIDDIEKIKTLINATGKNVFARVYFRRDKVGCCILEAVATASGRSIESLAPDEECDIHYDPDDHNSRDDPDEYLSGFLGLNDSSILSDIYASVDQNEGEFIEKDEIMLILETIKEAGRPDVN